MTKEQISELRRLEADATMAPWIAAASSVVMPVEDFDISTPRPEEADLIAAARNALPRLLDEREALLDALNRCRELFIEIRGDWTDPRSECREGRNVIDAAIAKAEAP